MDRRRASGIALVLVSAAAFGSGSLFAQPVYAAGVDWLTLSAWRFLFGAGLTWVFLLVSADRRSALRSQPRGAVLAGIALGVMYVGNSGTYYAALETVSPSLAALVVYLYPAIVAVLSIRFAHRLQGRRAWIALGIALIGVVLAVGGIDPNHAPPVSGLALAFASCFIYAVWVILAARISGERREAVADASGQAGSATAAVAIIMSATASVYWFAALVTGRPVLPMQIPVGAWLGLFGVGVGATFIAIQTFYAGAQRVGAAQASLISTAEPIWTIALAAILFSVALTPVQLVGGAFILAGVVIAQTGPVADRAPALDLDLRVADE
ncbi:MAG: DMT family transporter [Chloroflexota bacterium]|jgi:drug/metabolite transporter (DMT)-like permease